MFPLLKSEVSVGNISGEPGRSMEDEINLPSVIDVQPMGAREGWMHMLRWGVW